MQPSTQASTAALADCAPAAVSFVVIETGLEAVPAEPATVAVVASR